jgi:cobalt-zinc-cadmium efflux system outer membrane protein
LRVYCLVILVFFGGCQQYQEIPLDGAAVEKALTLPPEQTLRVKAESLNHPVVPPVILDQSDGLSPDEAAILAVLANPSLKAVRDKRGIAAGQLLEAGLLPNPQLGTSYDTPSGGTTEGTVDAYGVGVSWDVSELISRSSRVSAARKNKASIDLDIAWQEWQIAEAAKTAVYDLFSLQSQLDLAVESDQRLKENFTVVQQAVQAGLMTKLDLAAAQTASQQAHAVVLELQKQTSEQKAALNQVIGLNAGNNIILQCNIEFPLSMKIPPIEKLLDNLEKRRLDLVALKLGYESQQDTLRAAVLNQFPRINIGVNNARDTGNVVTSGIGLTIDLPVFNRNQGQIAIERATRQQLFDEYVSRVFETRATITKLSTDIPVIIQQIETAQAAAESSQRLVETYKTALQEGQADVLSYYTAWNDQTEKQMEIIKLKQQLMDTCIALELETGLYNLDESNVPAEPLVNVNNKKEEQK